MRKAQQTRSLVAAWFDFLPPTELPVAQAIHKAIRAVVSELGETIRQGNLLMSLNGEPLLAIAPARNQVHLLIFNGADVEDMLGPLEGVGRRQRMVKFPSSQPVDPQQVQAIARASAEIARRQQALQGSN
ncbi:MAG TPA: DUF1801 domain-containing protein [Burkholderiaceae bacterium]